MSRLLASQSEFMAHVLDEDRPLPPGWTPRHAAGLAVYRNAYRTRLVDAVRDTYERTARWVGDDAFRAAAAHHAIQSPPQSWTLDHMADGFVEVLEELFANDPEVAGLAWLEWAMHRAFVSADTAGLDAGGFGAATAAFAEDDWTGLRLEFLPSLHFRTLAHDVGAIWNTLADDEFTAPEYGLASPRAMIVWREALRPTFMPLDDAEGHGLKAMIDGKNYGEMVESLALKIGEESAIAHSGAMLGRWLAGGLITAVR